MRKPSYSKILKTPLLAPKRKCKSPNRIGKKKLFTDDGRVLIEKESCRRETRYKAASDKRPRVFVFIRRNCRAPKQPDPSLCLRLLLLAWSNTPAVFRQKLTAKTVGRKRIALSADVLLESDAWVKRINKKHFRRNGVTDVMSFPLGDWDFSRKALHLGEVAVDFQTALREAKARGISYREESARYVAHGFLHLLGFRDGTKAERESMFAVQERLLAAVDLTRGP
jgi:rRNA maturation RNase YbeY